MLAYSICVSLSDLLHSVWQTKAYFQSGMKKSDFLPSQSHSCSRTLDKNSEVTQILKLIIVNRFFYTQNFLHTKISYTTKTQLYHYYSDE